MVDRIWIVLNNSFSTYPRKNVHFYADSLLKDLSQTIDQFVKDRSYYLKIGLYYHDNLVLASPFWSSSLSFVYINHANPSCDQFLLYSASVYSHLCCVDFAFYTRQDKRSQNMSTASYSSLALWSSETRPNDLRYPLKNSMKISICNGLGLAL